jgi:hypothetical protein
VIDICFVGFFLVKPKEFLVVFVLEKSFLEVCVVVNAFIQLMTEKNTEQCLLFSSLFYQTIRTMATATLQQ